MLFGWQGNRGLAESNGSLPPGLSLSHPGWLPVPGDRDQLRVHYSYWVWDRTIFTFYPRSSPNGTQKDLFGSEPDMKMYVENFGCFHPLKWGPKPLVFDVIRRLRNLWANLTANVCGMKHHTDNRERCRKIQRVPYNVAKFYGLWAHKCWKVSPAFLPTLRNSAFCIIAMLRTRRSGQPNFAKL